MNTKNALSSVVVLVLIVAAGAVYFHYAMPMPAAQLPPAATPDNTVVAGPVASVSATSLTVLKQDGTTQTLSITSNTSVVASSGQTSVPMKLSDITVGTMVLVSPGSDGSAGSIIIVSAPPAPPAQ